jgi:diguanylate cyclase
LRWEHPERGLINPNDFVPFAEKTGFITLMTRWVIDQSLKQVNLWQKEAISVEVSVNVSFRDLSDKDFPTFVVSRLRAHKIAPQRLTLEVPDKVLALGYERILPQLTILTGVGVKIAIDDFGGGFLSLQYLREMKPSSAKIDRTFINALTKDKSRAILVSSAIALSHSMKMTVVAQGVEDTETMALLRKLRCDFAQGYYFGKPLKAAEYKRWVQHQADKYQTGEQAAMSEV